MLLEKAYIDYSNFYAFEKHKNVYKLIKSIVKKEEITLRKILIWILDNSEDTEAMDKINKTTFPYTTNYKRYNNLENE